MLTDFERKLSRIIQNDDALGRVTNLSDLEQRTGHECADIEAAIKRLKTVYRSKGGLKR